MNRERSVAAALIVAAIGYEEHALQQQTPERNDTWTGIIRWGFQVHTEIGAWAFKKTLWWLTDWFEHHILGDAD